MRPSRPISKHLPSRVLIILSGENSTLPEAEAGALLRTYDPSAVCRKMEPRVLIALTKAKPEAIAGRIAYARRVGVLLPSGHISRVLREKVKRGSFRIRKLRLAPSRTPVEQIEGKLLSQLDGRVDLDDPDYEVSVIEGKRVYSMLTRPRSLRQDWASRRPRRRPFFHPAAIFPKLSRALVNLSGVKEGEILMDPFAGTGSVLLEASVIGILPVAIDISRSMVRGALANQREFSQSWLGIIQADARSLPVRKVDGIVTDVPYGRASSSHGRSTGEIVRRLLSSAANLLARERVLVIMHPDYVKVTPTREFIKESAHRLYIHRNLTRVITVLRRV